MEDSFAYPYSPERIVSEEISIRAFTDTESFLDKLNTAFLKLFPKEIEGFSYNLIVLEEIEHRQSAGITWAIIVAKETYPDNFFPENVYPEIAFSIEQESGGWMKIVAKRFHYHEYLIDPYFQMLVDVFVAEYKAPNVFCVEVSDRLLEEPPENWKGIKSSKLMIRFNVQKKTLYRMIQFEDKYAREGWLSYAEIGKKFGISRRQAWNIVDKMRRNSVFFPNTIAAFGASSDLSRQ